jgi:SAM-dependent methyltransferase
VDVSTRLLRAAQERLRSAGLDQRIKGVYETSGDNLECLRSDSLDILLMLGPFYHLSDARQRQQAIEEARRTLRSGGVLFAAGINRLAYLRDLFRENPDEAINRKSFHKQFLTDGKLDPEHAPPIGYAQVTTVSEFRTLFAPAFDEILLVGTESFSTAWQQTLADLPVQTKEA